MLIWIGVLVCNLIWAANPSVAKLIIADVGPLYTAWLKYTVAVLAYALVATLLRRRASASERPPVFIRPARSKSFLLVVVLGLTTCFLSPLLQMRGLNASSALTNSLLVAFEPLFTVLLGALLLREKIDFSAVISFLLALGGFAVLSAFSASDLALRSLSSVQIGDLLLLAAVANEAVYSVLVKKLAGTYAGSSIFGTAMLIGATCLTVVVFLFFRGMPPAHVGGKTVAAILWLGAVGTAVPYLIWAKAVSSELPLGAIVVSLFLQPVFGVAMSALILGEPITGQQLIGGTLILGAVAIQMAAEQKSIRSRSQGGG